MDSLLQMNNASQPLLRDHSEESGAGNEHRRHSDKLHAGSCERVGRKRSVLSG